MEALCSHLAAWPWLGTWQHPLSQQGAEAGHWVHTSLHCPLAGGRLSSAAGAMTGAVGRQGRPPGAPTPVCIEALPTACEPAVGAGKIQLFGILPVILFLSL